MVNADGVTVDRQDRPAEGEDNIELTSSVIALDLNDRQLDSIFVVGSSDLDPVVSSIDTVAAAPVISSSEADMAMARGAAVAAAMAVNTLDGAAAPLLKVRRMSKTGVLTSVVAAAAVTLVVSLSVVLGLRLLRIRTPNRLKTPTPPASSSGRCAVGSEGRAGRAQASSRRTGTEARSGGATAAGGAAGSPDDGRCASGSCRAGPGIHSARPAPAYVPPAPAPAYVPPAPAPAYVPPQPQVPAVSRNRVARRGRRTQSDRRPVPRSAVSVPDTVVAQLRCT